MANIDNNQDLLDSRGVIARIEELTDSINAYENPEGNLEAHDAMVDEKEELKELQALAEQCESYGDWEHGETLIRESYFKDYAQELAEDIGAIDRNAKWPNTCIDWDQAARELKMDYTEVDFGGVAYLMRA
jgi:hypothetical protein